MPLSFASVAQLDRVSVSETEGHRFDPCRVHQYIIVTPSIFTILTSNSNCYHQPIFLIYSWFFVKFPLISNSLGTILGTKLFRLGKK